MDYLDGRSFQAEKEYIEAIFTLGGLSECGKTTAGIRLENLPFGIKRYKIIEIEKEMMIARGYNISSGLSDNHFLALYRDNTEEVFKEFTMRLIAHLKEEGATRVSIESLYRAPLGEFLKREFGEKCSNIYIEAPVELRARRQYLKKRKEALVANDSCISYELVLDSVKKKDEFKEQHNAPECKRIADYVIENDENMDMSRFLYEIDRIAIDTIYGTHNSTHKVKD